MAQLRKILAPGLPSQNQKRGKSGRIRVSYESRTSFSPTLSNYIHITTMSGEIFNAAILSSTLILVGLSLGFLLLKIEGGEEA
jgi:cytochrome b6-f complex subunit 7